MGLFGSRKRVLLVGSEGVALFGPTARGVERETALSWEVPNFDQQLTEALTEQNRSDPVLILFDGADQTYRKEENVPQLFIFDRIRYIKRKLEQAFPTYPVRASILVEPAKTKDKSTPKEPPFYLFVALPETDRLDRVSGDILEAGVPVSGFGLLPAESVGLVSTLSNSLFKKGAKRSRWAVLIAQHETGGLRQVVVKDGNLALTRITPTSEAGIQGPAWVDEVLREFKATLTYIARFGYNADEGLDVVIICGNIEKQFFNQKSLPVTNFECLTITEALTAIGSRGVSLGEHNLGDALHAAWAARKRALAAPVVVPSIHRIMMPRLGARIGVVILALALLGSSIFVFNEYKNYTAIRDETIRQQGEKALKESLYAEESKVFDALPVKPQVVRGALTVKGLVESSGVNITPTLNVLRRNLDSDIRLSQLKFEHDASGIIRVGTASSLVPQPSPAPGEEKGFVKISFKFNISGNVTLEQKVVRAERLAENLRHIFPGYTVKIVSQFGNVSRTGRFSGEAGKAQGGAKPEESAEFEMNGVPL